MTRILQRQYIAAYQAQNGQIVPFAASATTVMREHVQADVDRWNAEEIAAGREAPFFVAFRDQPSWERADTRGCGHPNHGADDHDCAPFRSDQ